VDTWVGSRLSHKIRPRWKGLPVTSTVAYYKHLQITDVKSFITLGLGANVIKLLPTVIYCHSMVIPSFCVINLYYLGNYLGMAVNYRGIKLFYNIHQKCLLSVANLKYHGNFLW
jgi:hypothetical protein